MPLSEFALIERYFRKAGAMRADSWVSETMRLCSKALQAHNS
jgi:hypothetical protein